MTKSVNQLSKYFRPENYDLRLDIDRINRRFNGVVKIKGHKVGDQIRLHSKDLEISAARINGSKCEVIGRDDDEIELRSATNFDGQLLIELEFSGKIIDGSMHGLYVCHYEDDGVARELLATQFESHHAREVFPCVDEPAAKATFDLTLTTEEKITNLSNMPIKNQTETAGRLTTKFDTTPKMSTYLLAFVLGDLRRKTARTKSGVEVSVYATPAQPTASLDFALETAAECIDFYDKYFGVKYPLPKSDHVALPDFSSGAMENWGLVTYREMALLTENNFGILSKQYIATVIAHELSHQWFGNLTTMKWWNDLWLNESFASLMEHIAVDALFPDWNIWQTFETGDVIAALKRDALPGVQAVRQDVHHPDEISTLFDPAIVYSKGERLLKMLRAFIGEDNFRAGLQQYFEKFAYDNTSANDLWKCLGDVSGQNVAALMNPWLTRPGYPVVRVSFENGIITLKQQRFLSDGSTDDTIWPILLFANDPAAPKIMDAPKISFRPENLENFQLNVGNNAHFIAVYNENLKQSISRRLKTFAPVDRAKLLNEVGLMVQPGLVPTSEILELLPACFDENNNAVWDIISMLIAVVGRFTEIDSEDEKRLKKLAGQLAKLQYKRIGWRARRDESMNDRKLRPTIISQMIFSEDENAIKEALAIYSKHRRRLSEIDGDLRPIILGAAVRYGEPEEFDYLLTTHKLTQNAELKQDIAGGLTLTRRPEQIDAILGFLNKAEVVRNQDLFYWYVWMLKNRRARGKTWTWLTEGWDWIEKTFGGDKSYDAFPRYAGQILQTQAELENYQAFFEPKSTESALRRAIEVGQKDISARAKWLDRDRASVLKKLQDMVDLNDDN